MQECDPFFTNHCTYITGNYEILVQECPQCKLCFTVHTIFLYALPFMNLINVRNGVCVLPSCNTLVPWFRGKALRLHCGTEEIHVCKTICTRHYCGHYNTRIKSYHSYIRGAFKIFFEADN